MQIVSTNRGEGLLDQVMALDKKLQVKLQTLAESMQSLVFEVEDLYQQFVYHFMLYDMQSDEDIDYIFHVEDLTPSIRKQTRLVIRLMQESGILFNQLVEALMTKYEEGNHYTRQVLDEFHMLRERFIDYVESFMGIVTSANASDHKSSWLNIPAHLDVQSLTLKGFENAENNDLKKQLAEMTHVIFVSGTLAVKKEGQTVLDNFIDKRLVFKKIPSPFDVAAQVRVIVPQNLKTIRYLTQAEYAQMIADNLAKVASISDDNILVLFNSLETLSTVHNLLKKAPEFNNRPILAQRVHGSKHRLLKQFHRLPGTILLGANAFWEGIDLPGEALKILVMTRLPFESPDIPLVKMRHAQLRGNNENPFTADMLPRAVIQFKQGFGRLIRSAEDKGIMMVLDDRLINASYSRVFQEALPPGVEIKRLADDEFESLSNFLNEKI